MKKLLLMVVVALVSLTTMNAQILSNQTWNATIMAASATDAVYDGPVAIGQDGGVYVAGALAKSVTLGDYVIPTPEEKGSSYIVKYDADGIVEWASYIDGQATITSMTVDNKGVLYVAGQFADEVWVYDSDLETYMTIGGADVAGAFIAKYAADGTLNYVRTIVPSIDPDIEMTGMYGWSGETPSFEIYKIQAEGSNLYVGATYCGDVVINDYTSKGEENPAGNLTLQGRYALAWGFMYTDMPTTAVFSYSTSKMNKPTLVADIAPAAEVMETDAPYKVQSANFVVDGSKIYVAAVGYGNLAATTVNGKTDVTFFMDGAGTYEPGLVVVKTGASDVVKLYNNAYTTLSTDSYNNIKDMDLTNGTLYISGTYRGGNPFDNTMVTEGVSTSDTYVASLDAYTLEKNWVAAIPNKGDAENSKYEDIQGTIIYPAGIQIAGAVKDIATHAADSYYNYAIDFNGNVTSLSQAATGSLAYSTNSAAYTLTMSGATFLYYGDLATADSYTGVAGENVIYTFTPANGTIAFTGSGEMYEYESTDENALPWVPFKDAIVTATIENGITNVPGYAFSKCAELENVTLPNSILVISRNAFASCSALTQLTIPYGVKELAVNAFNACGFSSIDIPNSVTTMGNTIFSGCTSLESVKLSKSVTVLPSSTFTKCSALKEVYVPESYKTLMFGVFHSCSSLTKVTLAASVDSIGDYAFYNNTKLSKIYSMNTVPPKAPGSKVFTGVTATTAVYVPTGSLDAYQVADGWKNFWCMESDFSGIEDAVVEYNNNVVVKGNNVVIEGYVGKVQIISMNGQVVKDMMVNDYAEIVMPQGLYLVVTSNATQKVIVK